MIAVLIGAPTPEAGATEHLLMAGAPLINAFPAMAVTTAAVLVLAGFRLVRQRIGPDDAFGQVRRRFSGGRTEDVVPDGGSGRDRTTARPSVPRTSRGRPKPADAVADAAAGVAGRGSDRGRRTNAQESDARATGTRPAGAAARAGSGRPAPRTGASRSSTGSTRADEPSRSRRPHRS